VGDFLVWVQHASPQLAAGSPHAGAGG